MEVSATEQDACDDLEVPVAVHVPSIFDSRTQNASQPISNQDDQVVDPTARYLTHQSSSSTLTFDAAFEAIKKTESYTNPPPIVVEPLPSSSANAKDAATVVLVNRCQTGNPLLKAIKNVCLEFRDGLIPDYIINPTCCVLFLSIRYHLLHPSYLEDRIGRIRKEQAMQYKLKVIVCLVDVEDNEKALCEINRVSLLSQCTLLLAWSWPEAARYIETLKAYENKSATLIKEKVQQEFLPQATDVLTTIRSVNKTDVVTLLSTFGNIKKIMNASLEELSLCPGVGAKKVRQLLETFQEPFIKEHSQ